MIKKYITILAVSTVTTMAVQAQLTYTESGGNISGSLNGVGFSGATWSITATANPSAATFYGVGGNIYAPAMLRVARRAVRGSRLISVVDRAVMTRETSLILDLGRED